MTKISQAGPDQVCPPRAGEGSEDPGGGIVALRRLGRWVTALWTTVPYRFDSEAVKAAEKIICAHDELTERCQVRRLQHFYCPKIVAMLVTIQT